MIVDIVVGAIILISAAISFLRGFIREVLTIAGVVGGVMAALFLGPKFSPIVRGWFGVEDGEEVEKLFDLIPMNVAADVTAYAAIFVIVVIAISVLSHFISGAVKAMGLGPIDRTLGIFFGVARGLILLGLFYLPFHLMMQEDTKEELFKDSHTHYIIEETSAWLSGFLPDAHEVEDTVAEKSDDFKKELLKKNLLPGDKKDADKDKKEDDETKAKTGTEGYNDKERGAIDNLFEAPGEGNE